MKLRDGAVAYALQCGLRRLHVAPNRRLDKRNRYHRRARENLELALNLLAEALRGVHAGYFLGAGRLLIYIESDVLRWVEQDVDSWLSNGGP